MPTLDQIVAARLRAAEAASFLGAAERLRREYLIADLRYAIEAMAERYADSRTDKTLAQVTGNDDIAARHRRASRRRHAALRRLTLALANVAGA